MLEVCECFRHAASGYEDLTKFARASEGRGERGIDATAVWSGKEGSPVHVQVTRVERGVLRALATSGTACSDMSIAELADAVAEAVDAKAHQADPQVLLLLDALHSPAHARPEVVEALQLHHGGRLSTTRWREIWLVGPARRVWLLHGAAEALPA